MLLTVIHKEADFDLSIVCASKLDHAIHWCVTKAFLHNLIYSHISHYIDKTCRDFRNIFLSSCVGLLRCSHIVHLFIFCIIILLQAVDRFVVSLSRYAQFQSKIFQRKSLTKWNATINDTKHRNFG